MKCKNLLIISIIWLNFAIASPSFADSPKFFKNPDYIEVTKTLNDLSATKDERVRAGQATPQEIEKKIDELEFQKYTLETGLNWGQCTNQTGKTLAVYGPKPDLDDDDDDDDTYPYKNALYFLADGQTTKNQWDCDGVYLPSGTKVAGPIAPTGYYQKPTDEAKTPTVNSNKQNQEWESPLALKILDGTKLVVKANPDTGSIEFNLPSVKFIKPDEANWFIPNVTQADIDTRVPNAKVAES
jgi:hypothetical protein